MKKSRCMSEVYNYYFGGHKSIMKSFARFRVHHWLTICIIAVVALFSVGCKSSRSDSGALTNPLAAYSTTTNPTNSSGNVIGDGNTIVPGSLNTPVITIPDDGSSSISGHDNAPLLDNKHPGWQQTNCLTCHNDTTNNPDHNYNDDSLCYLCHGTNGLPGMADSTPPVLSSVVVSPTDSTVTVSWKSDEPCTSRLTIKTTAGDKMEFPVSTTYSTSHKRTVSGLQSSTTYYYELTCLDKSGNKTSSSSFSSVLSFTTTEPVTIPVVETTPEEEVQEGEPSDSYFQNFSVNCLGGKVVRVTFETKADPRSSGFFWYIYDNKDKAKKKTDHLDSDSFSGNLNNKYELDIQMTSQKENQYYYVRVQALLANEDKSKWSYYYRFKLTN